MDRQLDDLPVQLLESLVTDRFEGLLEGEGHIVVADRVPFLLDLLDAADVDHVPVAKGLQHAQLVLEYSPLPPRPIVDPLSNQDPPGFQTTSLLFPMLAEGELAACHLDSEGSAEIRVVRLSGHHTTI